MTQSMYILLLLFVPHIALAINCNTPQTNLDKTICGDYRLSHSHERLIQIYKQSDENQYKAWLQTLKQQCETLDKTCLHQQYEQQIRALSQKTWPFTAQINPELPTFKFELIGIEDEESAHVQKIVISNQDSTSLQTLVIANVSEMLNETETLWLQKGDGFKIEDVNFDGYKDIRLMEFLPAGANVPYLYWLYQPTQQKFVFNTQFSQLAHLTIDKDKKQIISQYRINAVEHGTNYYTVNQYRLILVRQELLQYLKNDDGEQALFELVKERIDGELRVTSQKAVD